MIYLDNAATTGYKPPQVINAFIGALKYLSANAGRGGHSQSIKAARLVESVRQAVASQFGATDVSRVLFSLNCTDALNTAILGTVRRGGHVITTVNEHNSVLRPLFALKNAGDIELTVVKTDKNGAPDVAEIAAAVRGNTYLVAVNHVSNVTGAVADVERIAAVAKANRAMLLLDAAQSAGYVDIDIAAMGVDMLALAPHKGIHAGQGVGVLVVEPNVDIAPIRFGGTGTASASVLQPRGLPEGMESGTLPLPAIAGVGAALGWLDENKKFVRQKVSALAIELYERLKATKGVCVLSAENPVSGIVSFFARGIDSGEIADLLSSQYDVAARSGLHCAPLVHDSLGTTESGLVRLSVGCDTSYREILFVVDAIREIVSI